MDLFKPPNANIRAIARVQIVVEVKLSQPWGPDATMGQAHRQATEEALQKVRSIPGVMVVGSPRVQVVTFEEGSASDANTAPRSNEEH